jgi:hypothetical protein
MLLIINKPPKSKPYIPENSFDFGPDFYIVLLIVLIYLSLAIFVTLKVAKTKFSGLIIFILCLFLTPIGGYLVAKILFSKKDYSNKRSKSSKRVRKKKKIRVRVYNCKNCKYRSRHSFNECPRCGYIIKSTEEML